MTNNFLPTGFTAERPFSYLTTERDQLMQNNNKMVCDYYFTM